MPALSPAEISSLLRPFLEAPIPAPADPLPRLTLLGLAPLAEALSSFLDLLLRWNARTNLTAIREPREIVDRHFGESLFAGRLLATVLQPGDTVLDYGSGAGFPGIPIQLLLPDLKVTLAESQGKKASFLREAVRTLNLPSTEVWSARVADLPAARRFTAVTLRAVDRMEDAEAEAETRVAPGGWLLTLGQEKSTNSLRLPGSQSRYATLRAAV